VWLGLLVVWLFPPHIGGKSEIDGQWLAWTLNRLTGHHSPHVRFPSIDSRRVGQCTSVKPSMPPCRH